MRQSKRSSSDIWTVASETGITADVARRIINSFFDAIVLKARALPFDDAGRIYSKAAFEEKGFVVNIPYIGRIGTSYSRYLTWRRNEAKHLKQENRSKYRNRLSSEDIEKMADDILSGKPVTAIRKKKGNELYKRVWYVEQGQKRLARQVIQKEN